MTIYYYSLDVEIENYVGDSDPSNQIPQTVIRTIPIRETINLRGKIQSIRDNFSEEFFDTNKESLAAESIKAYNKTHKSQVSRVIGIRRTPIIE